MLTTMSSSSMEAKTPINPGFVESNLTKIGVQDTENPTP